MGNAALHEAYASYSEIGILLWSKFGNGRLGAIRKRSAWEGLSSMSCSVGFHNMSHPSLLITQKYRSRITVIEFEVLSRFIYLARLWLL